MALRGVGVVEFTPLLSNGEGTLAKLPNPGMESNSGADNNALVSHPIIPVTIPVEVVILSSGHRENLITLLNSGCTRCLVSPSMVEKLGMHLRELRVPIAFCQPDGSVNWRGGEKHNLCQGAGGDENGIL